MGSGGSGEGVILKIRIMKVRNEEIVGKWREGLSRRHGGKKVK